MSIKTLNTWTLDQFKASFNVDRIEVFTATASGKSYGKNKATGEFIGMMAKDFDKSKPVMIFEVTDEESGETWKFFGNGEPKEADYTM